MATKSPQVATASPSKPSDTEVTPNLDQILEEAFESGADWASRGASRHEKTAIFEAVIGRRQPPRLSACESIEQAVLEFVRFVCSPSGHHVDTAMEYWRLTDFGLPQSPADVKEFFAGACDRMEIHIMEDAARAAERWISKLADHADLLTAAIFKSTELDGWFKSRPKRCATPFEVALHMVGRGYVLKLQDCQPRQHFAAFFGTMGNSFADCEMFAEEFIVRVLDRLPPLPVEAIQQWIGQFAPGRFELKN